MARRRRSVGSSTPCKAIRAAAPATPEAPEVAPAWAADVAPAVAGKAKPPAARAAGRVVGVEAAPKGPVTFMQDVSFYASHHAARD
ncbi:hypothetical protein GCM10009434_10110 [Brevundimonas olei]